MSIEKVINKKFDTLEDKVNNILNDTKIGIYTIKKQQLKEMIKIFHKSSNEGIEYVSNLCVNPSKNLNVNLQDTCSGTECEAIITSVCKKDFVLIGDYHTHVTDDSEDIPSIIDLKSMYEHKYPVECIGSTKNNTIKCYTRKDMKIKSDLFFIRLWIDILKAIIKLTELDKTMPENFLENSIFEVRNILKKHFIETLIYSKSPKKDQLTGEDIFDITTTEMPYYNSMIQKGHIAGNRDPVEYFKSNKGITFKIEWMNPEEYLLKAYKMHRDFIDDLEFEFYIDTNVDFELVEKYKERTLSDSKMPIPVLDYNSMSQEGRHRAIVAQQLDVEEIPVLVVRPYEE